MTDNEKQQFLHSLAAMLQENIGNKLTHTLINGVCTTLDSVIKASPPAAEPPTH